MMTGNVNERATGEVLLTHLARLQKAQNGTNII
jgi:hypothetical protein